ncbi:MAG TPA: glycosyltransferase family 2 protein [Thermoanaerobaculia bacterium]|nr:glycosyltransferase family 2 protein [Thermoanaerobaculia bacterium]
MTIAMPAYNEEDGIEEAVREALKTLDRLEGGGEVLVVDDGSTDGTSAILEEIQRGDPRLRVHRHEENLGIGGFNRSMVREARGEWIFFIGSDGEWDSNESLRFLALARSEELDGVLGYRTEKLYSPWRRLVSFSFNHLTRLCFGVGFRDVGSIRLLRRSLFGPLRLYSRSAFLNAERLLVGVRAGARLAEVPVAHRPRLAGRGGGAKLRRVIAAVRDLLVTRWRWSRFETYYG